MTEKELVQMCMELLLLRTITIQMGLLERTRQLLGEWDRETDLLLVKFWPLLDQANMTRNRGKEKGL